MGLEIKVDFRPNMPRLSNDHYPSAHGLRISAIHKLPVNARQYPNRYPSFMGDTSSNPDAGDLFPFFDRINSSDAPSRNSILPVKKGALISNLREILTNPTTGSQLSFEDFLTRSPREAIADIIDFFSSDAHQQLYSLSVLHHLSQRLI